jgi:hypothetical protein
MYQKPCNLARAATYFMGGGGSAPSVSGSIGDVVGSFPQIQHAFRGFRQSEPLLRNLQQFGLQAGGAISPYILGILQHPYDLPPELRNMATQTARAAFQQRGNVFGNQAIGAEVLGRESAVQNRIARAMGLAGQTEQLYGYPEQVATSAFSSLINPAYGLAGQTLGAQTAADAAGKGATQSTIGTIGSVVGSVAAAY